MSDKSETTDKGQGETAAEATGKALVPTSAKADGKADAAPPEGLRALAMDYPFALLAGGIVAGVVIGALLPRPNPGRLARNVGALAGVVGELGLAYARRAVDGVSEVAETAAEAGGKMAEAVGERTSGLVGAAADTVGSYSGKAAETAENAVANLRHSAEGLARQVIRLTSHLRH
ncbi:hypothetical protein [Novosphingobium sp.]|uniref:hypothetical protein n=1 Tax=Novosphingobium sp. TaxID=1874826 RepID=UPI0026146F0F|nr:hypothetical protein [Novosphingobium sp.]